MAQRRNYTEVREYAAHRQAGRRWWRWYVIYKPALRVVAPPFAAAALLYLAWWKIPHPVLGIATAAVAVTLTAGWLAYQSSDRALQRRMNGRATVPRGAGLGWAVAGVVVGLAATSALALWGV